MAGATKLFVGCLPYSKTEEDVAALFAQFGPLTEVALLKDNKTGMSKGAAFVNFEHAEHAEVACANLADFVFPGSSRKINVSVAAGAGGGGGGGGGGCAGGCGGIILPSSAVNRPGGAYFGGGGIYAAGVGEDEADGAEDAHGARQQQAYVTAGYANGCKGGRPSAVQPPAPSGKVAWRPVQPQVPSPTSQKGVGKSPSQPPPPTTPFPGFAPVQNIAQAAGLQGTKLFVGQLPYSRSEPDLYTLFGSIGSVVEVILHRNPATNEKKGAAFVRMAEPLEAEAAVTALDGYTFEGATRPITVSLARSDDGVIRSPAGTPAGLPMVQMVPTVKGSFGVFSNQAVQVAGLQPMPFLRPAAPSQQTVFVPKAAREAGMQADDEAKLFVGQLPFSRNENDLSEVFEKYGQVAEVILLKDAQGMKKGAAFVKYFNLDDAVQALELDGYLFGGSTRPITVSMAAAGGAAKKRRIA